MEILENLFDWFHCGHAVLDTDWRIIAAIIGILLAYLTFQAIRYIIKRLDSALDNTIREVSKGNLILILAVFVSIEYYTSLILMAFVTGIIAAIVGGDDLDSWERAKRSEFMAEIVFVLAQVINFVASFDAGKIIAERIEKRPFLSASAAAILVILFECTCCCGIAVVNKPDNSNVTSLLDALIILPIPSFLLGALVYKGRFK